MNARSSIPKCIINAAALLGRRIIVPILGTVLAIICVRIKVSIDWAFHASSAIEIRRRFWAICAHL